MKKNPESGYALLLIFSMAAIVAIMLYREVPRAAFEAQRDKEQLLEDRGQEYSRAIALFVRKNNRFPGTMEELENTNNQRYLRRRFVDPMTGKAEWRILHAGPGGVITDSVTGAKGASGSTWQTDMTTLQMTSAAPSGDSAGANMATRRRPSDTGANGGDPLNASFGNLPTNDPGTQNPAASPNPTQTNNGGAGYNGPVMVLPDGRIVPANASGSAPPPGGANGATGSSPLPGMPGIPSGVPGGPPLPTGIAVQQNTQNLPGTPLPPGAVPGGPPNSAAGLINQILTTPRPGGLNGFPGGQGVTPQGQQLTGTLSQTAAPQQQVIGAGLAGVASKKEQEGIKIFNDRTKYNEWEFIYDIANDPSRQRGGAVGAPGATGGPGRGGPNSPVQPNGMNPGFGGSGMQQPLNPGRGR